MDDDAPDIVPAAVVPDEARSAAFHEGEMYILQRGEALGAAAGEIAVLDAEEFIKKHHRAVSVEFISAVGLGQSSADPVYVTENVVYSELFRRLVIDISDAVRDDFMSILFHKFRRRQVGFVPFSAPFMSSAYP